MRLTHDEGAKSHVRVPVPLWIVEVLLFNKLICGLNRMLPNMLLVLLRMPPRGLSMEMEIMQPWSTELPLQIEKRVWL